jgi:putative endopeptidase
MLPAPRLGFALRHALSTVLAFALVAAAGVLLSAAAGAPSAAPPAAATPTAASAPAALPYSPALDPAAMDRNVDPCVDFYAYSCGGWLRSHPIPPDQARWSVFEKLHSDNLTFLGQVLETAAVPGPARDRYFAALPAPDLAALKDLNVAEPGFFSGLEALLESADLASLRAYLRWRLVDARAGQLTPDFERDHFDFYEGFLRGNKEMKPRWRRCVEWVDRELGEALGKVYVERTFSPEAKARAVKMVGEIERAMDADLADLRQLPWMSAPTRAEALRKLHAMANKVGYPEHWRDYGPVRVERQDFAGNVQRATWFESRRQLAKIGKPVDRAEWSMTPPTVNAYYDPFKNDINFPAGVLQPPLFDPRLDDAPNYGDTGGTIGHELTHGFDDEGRQFDYAGNLRDWWTPADAREFQTRARCIEEQYARYTVVDDIKINSKLTLGEDVADLGGLLLAFRAWRDATRGQELHAVDGLTPEQRFFVGYAQSWCTNQREQDQRLRAVTDPHSPPRYRTNGVVSNLPEFREAYGCKTGQPMAPATMCRVW